MTHYNGRDRGLYDYVGAVLSGEQSLPDNQREDFILDVLECREPRYVEMVAGLHCSMSIDYTLLVQKALSRGLVNPTGWLLEKSVHALKRLNLLIPEGLESALCELQKYKDDNLYSLTTVLLPNSSVSDSDGDKWKILGKYTDQSIDRSVRRSWSIKEPLPSNS
ncbi:hypothetical protein J4206_03255 [Candidatus Woesearchaeota archaeon]|nr:hypothetical protein [Candidatus Woesearchaeota archaeon]